MKWVEIITLRSPKNINTQFMDELLKEVSKPDKPEHLLGIMEFVLKSNGDSRPQGFPIPNKKDNVAQTGLKIVDKDRFWVLLRNRRTETSWGKSEVFHANQ